MGHDIGEFMRAAAAALAKIKADFLEIEAHAKATQRIGNPRTGMGVKPVPHRPGPTA